MGINGGSLYNTGSPSNEWSPMSQLITHQEFDTLRVQVRGDVRIEHGTTLLTRGGESQRICLDMSSKTHLRPWTIVMALCSFVGEQETNTDATVCAVRSRRARRVGQAGDWRSQIALTGNCESATLNTKANDTRETTHRRSRRTLWGNYERTYRAQARPAGRP